MRSLRFLRSATMMLSLVAVLWMVAGAGPSAEEQLPGLPLEPLKEFGQLIYPVFEGWYDNPDGSYTFLIGYYNMNTKEELDIAIGESNFISPGPVDQGQPTHFNPGHGWGVFTIKVGPEYSDFVNTQMTWTLTANNQTMSVPFHTDPQWYLEPFVDAANGNQPPDLRFSDGGDVSAGPPVGVAQALSGTVGVPVELRLWTSDVTKQDGRESRRRPPLVLTWEKYRGPGDVAFDPERQEFDSADQTPRITATFSEPGEYILRVEAMDETGPGGGGSQCCWTSAHVKVTVDGLPVSTGQ